MNSVSPLWRSRNTELQVTASLKHERAMQFFRSRKGVPRKKITLEKIQNNLLKQEGQKEITDLGSISKHKYSCIIDNHGMIISNWKSSQRLMF